MYFQLGRNPSTIAEQKLQQGQTSTLGPGGQIYLLNNQYPHFIYFKMSHIAKSPQKTSKIDNDLSTSKSKETTSSISIKSKKRKIQETTDNNDDDYDDDNYDGNDHGNDIDDIYE